MNFLIEIYFILCVRMFVCMYVYIPLTCLVATQATRGFQMLWNWVIDSC